MTLPQAVRISPSGPFLLDPTSGQPIQVGPGSLGIIFRAQGGTATVLATNALATDAGLSVAPITTPLPAGYHYDVDVSVDLANTSTAGNVTIEVDLSEDGGATWDTIQSKTFMCATGQQTFRLGPVNLDRTAATLPINGLRVRCGNVSIAGVTTWHGTNSTIRVGQYIGPV